jgi:type III secretory pathway component EscS
MRDLLLQGVWFAVAASGVPLAAIAVCAGCASLLQVATQIQEASITHVARLAAIAAVVVLAGDVACTAVVEIFQRAIVVVVATGRQ